VFLGFRKEPFRNAGGALALRLQELGDAGRGALADEDDARAAHAAEHEILRAGVDRDRLLSGEGIGHIYDFLKADRKARDAPAVARAFESQDRAAVISGFALSGRDRLCRDALGMFVSIYGSEAGNLALQYRATGGVYVAGGIAGKILPALKNPVFRESFRAKPPLEKVLARIPVRVVRDPRLGLIGAVESAYRAAIETTR